MKHELFRDWTTPAVPEAVREAALQAARRTVSMARITWVDALWESRFARITWLLTVLSLFLFLAVWNPPVPGEKSPTAQDTVDPEWPQFGAVWNRKQHSVHAIEKADLEHLFERGNL